jgi:sugar phosphate isomerase/epimerase
VGLQLYTVRNLAQQSLERTLEQVASAGFHLVETAGLYGRRPEELRALFDRYELRSSSGHYPLDQAEGSLDTVVATARTLGQEWVVVPFLPPAQRSSLAAYTAIADRFNRIGEKVRAAGLRFAYHNHDFEFQTFGSSAPAYDTLAARTDPALVSFELDAYWAYKAGYDPLDLVRRFPGRIALLHVKDGTEAPAKTMTDVGKGVIDFGKLLAEAQAAGLRYAFVEHDQPADALASIRASHEYLARLLRAADAR